MNETPLYDYEFILGWGENQYHKLGIFEHEKNVCDTETMISSLSNLQIIHIVSGLQHTVALSRFGKVYTWGKGTIGELGLGNNVTITSKPEMVPLPEFITDIACGKEHTLVLGDSGSVYMWGGNSAGQIPICNDENYNVALPVKISLPFRVKSIACDDGDLYSCGADFEGQLGSSDATALKKVHISEKIDQVYATSGGSSSFAIQDGKSLFVWGFNHCGQIGIDVTEVSSQNIPIKHPLFEGKKIITMAPSSFHVAMLMEDGIYTFGENNYGQLGRATPKQDDYHVKKIDDLYPGYEKDVIQLSGGWGYTIVRTRNQEIWGWGSSCNGRLGMTPINEDHKKSQIRKILSATSRQSYVAKNFANQAEKQWTQSFKILNVMVGCRQVFVSCEFLGRWRFKKTVYKYFQDVTFEFTSY